jgi:hypothetical protein
MVKAARHLLQTIFAVTRALAALAIRNYCVLVELSVLS